MAWRPLCADTWAHRHRANGRDTAGMGVRCGSPMPAVVAQNGKQSKGRADLHSTVHLQLNPVVLGVVERQLAGYNP